MYKRFLALFLAVLLLSGCSAESFFLKAGLQYEQVSYSDMEYTRPDMDAIAAALEAVSQAAGEGDLDTTVDRINDFYTVYDDFSTCYALANIRYSGDLTSAYWEEEYNFCAENAPTVDAALEEMYCTLADSSLRQELEGDDYFGADFFLGYEESTMDETAVALMEQEAQLVAQYYDLTDQASSVDYYSEEFFSGYGTQMAQLYVQLLQLRRQLADHLGYDSYAAFAYDYYFLRDYTPREAEAYLQQVAQQLGPIYGQLDFYSLWEPVEDYCSEADTFDYVKTVAKAMGGTPQEAFQLLESAGLYDIRYSEKKFDTSFETYLWSYYEPFVFLCPYLDQSDKLTFAHEFGHFCNDYICGGSYAGTDVAEIHSQAFEYLSLCYGRDTENLTRYKMTDSLCTYVENAAYAAFEHRAYQLSQQELTVENLHALYGTVLEEFGMSTEFWDIREWVLVPHLFVQPMYVISYVVSNDVAMQLYELELEDPGAGLELYEQCLLSEESYLVYFTEQYGLISPLEPDRLEKVAAFFTQH